MKNCIKNCKKYTIILDIQKDDVLKKLKKI